jgi:HSP20 family protein
MTEEKGLEVQDKEMVESEAESTRDRPTFVPRVDIYEMDEAIGLVANMPGVDSESVDIMVEDNVLTINGNVDFAEPEGHSLSYAEYRVGDYQRSFRLSSGIDREQIEASLKDGVLRLRLPKIGPTTKKIAVKTG